MFKQIARYLITASLVAGLSGCVSGGGKVSPQEENALGAQQERQILSKVRTIKSGKLYYAVRNVGSRIARVANRPDFQWSYHLVDDPKVANAFVLPGGKVFVYSGLFRYASNENELAVVIAHEIAHALKSHGVEGAQRKQTAGLLGAVLQVGMGVAGVDPTTAKQVSTIYNQGATLGYIRPHSRKDEYEADSLGLMLMAKAGYDPRAALTFWDKFGKTGQSVPEYLSTHPDPRNRIANIKRLMPQALALYEKSRKRYARR